MQRYEQTIGVNGKVDDTVVISKGSSYDRLRETLAVLRDKSADMLIKLFGERDGGILSAMVLGEKSNLDSELKSLYQRNGIIHIMAISGVMMSIIGICV